VDGEVVVVVGRCVETVRAAGGFSGVGLGIDET